MMVRTLNRDDDDDDDDDDGRWGDDDSGQGGSIQPLYYTTVPEHPQVNKTTKA